MTNLLPLEAEKAMWRTYRSRFVIVGSLVLLALSGLALCSLIPGYIAIRLAAPAAIEMPRAERDGSDDPVSIRRTQALIETMAPLLSPTSSPSVALREALKEKPRGVTVDRVSYSTGRIVLSGEGTRENIDAYRNVLVANKTFSAVSVPVSALVGRDGARYSLTLTGEF